MEVPAPRHRFVTRNLWHSCVRVALADHLDGKPPAVAQTFRALRAVIKGCGPVTCYAQKTRIVFQRRVRLANVTVRRSGIDVGLWLRRRVSHPALHRTESYGTLGYGHQFRLASPADIDDRLRSLVAEAYAAAHNGGSA